MAFLVDPTCSRCGRQRCYQISSPCLYSLVDSLRVVHDSYGCDTGCCGHCVVLRLRDGKEVSEELVFEHPSSLTKETLEEFVRDVVENWKRKYHVTREIPVRVDECELSSD